MADRAQPEDVAYQGFMELVRSRRSIRLFEDRPVPRSLLMKAIEAAGWAASGANIQPWDFLVVDEPSMVKQVADLLIAERKYILDRDPRFPAYGRSHRQAVPCYILVLSDLRLRGAYPQTTEFVVDLTQYAALGWATSQLHLALTALGLACYFNTPEEPTEHALKELLEIPDPYLLFAVTPVGFARQSRTSSRKPPAEIVHWNSFDRGRFKSDDEIQALIGNKKSVALTMSGR